MTLCCSTFDEWHGCQGSRHFVSMKFHHSKSCVQKLELIILINHNDDGYDDYIDDSDVDARRLCKMWPTKSKLGSNRQQGDEATGWRRIFSR